MSNNPLNPFQAAQQQVLPTQLTNNAGLGNVLGTAAGYPLPTPYVAYSSGPSAYDVRKDALQFCIQLLGTVNNVEVIVEQAKRLERFLITGE